MCESYVRCSYDNEQGELKMTRSESRSRLSRMLKEEKICFSGQGRCDAGIMITVSHTERCFYNIPISLWEHLPLKTRSSDKLT